MFGARKNILTWCGICVSALLLNACASAVFPDFDEDEDEIVVAEGGRVEQELKKESSSLEADSENAAYEDEDEDNGEEDAAARESGEEEVAAAETTPVVAGEIDAPTDADSDDNKVTIPAKPAGEDAEEVYTPSVSYRVETIYFNNGSSVVEPKYNASLRKIVKTAKENNATLIVYGHASSRTRDTDPATHRLANFKVSLERAQSVAAALRRAGMPAGKIITEAVSDSMPAYLEVMPEGERLNRRAEIYISY